MPYKIEQVGNKFRVIAQNTGHVAGTHQTKAKAEAQMAALYANEPAARGEKMNKAEGGYKPTSSMKAAARKAIKFKEDGKANGAGTNVGWTRAHQIVNGESLSLDTVKRMFSFFSRHEVDKKGKNWGSQADPSNGYIMWLAWGGDAGYSWSRRIVNAEKDKFLFSDFGKSVPKVKQLTEVFKREFSTRQRENMAQSGEAMPDGSYPIANRNDLMNAIRSWGRGGSDPKVKAHIKSRAQALGLSNLIPDNWK